MYGETGMENGLIFSNKYVIIRSCLLRRGLEGMNDDKKTAVQAIVNTTICSFAEGLKSRYTD